MRFLYDPRFVEGAVGCLIRRREAAGWDATAADFRRALDAVYERWPAERDEERVVAFREVYETIFHRLGLGTFVPDLLREFPGIPGRSEAAAIEAAPRREEEGGDLFVREGDPAEGASRTVVLRVYPESVADLAGLRDRLRRELLRIDDMLDPAFGYRPTLGNAFDNPGRRDLVRDRYALLWSLCVEGRLSRRGGDPGTRVLDSFRALARRAWPDVEPAVLDRLLDRVWTGGRMSHDELLEIAARDREPSDPLLCGPRGLCG